MKLELVTIPTPTWPLEGVYCQPEGAVKAAALIFHGNVANFYTGPARFLPPVLTKLGIACLAFNRRGHDILGNHNGREPVGGAFQTISTSLEDNELAAEWMAARGHESPAVIGHSNGGMLSVPFVANHRETPALVLMSAHKGGPGFLKFASEFGGIFAMDRFADIHAEAQRLVSEGKGATLLLMPGWFYCISAASFVDLLENMPDMFDHAPHINCPSLFIRGDQEAAEIYPAEKFADLSKGACDVRIIANCNHFYDNVESEVYGLVGDWLANTLAL